jgi:hypothetical protein
MAVAEIASLRPEASVRADRQFWESVAQGMLARPWLGYPLLVSIVYFGSTTSAHALLPLIPVLIGVVLGGAVAANEAFCFVKDCGTGVVQVPTQRNCLFCGIFVQLSCQGGSYSRLLYGLFAPTALSLARVLFLWFLALTLAKIFVWPKSGGEQWQELIKKCGLYFFVVALLTIGVAGGQNPWIFEWIFDLMQKLALATATMAIDFVAQQSLGRTITATVPNFGAGCAGIVAGTGLNTGNLTQQTAVAQQYANLWAHVEFGIWPVISTVMLRLSPEHFTASGAVSAIILAAPYVFVLGVFGAFMVQTMFYFIAVTAASPFLIAGMVFKTSQGWAISALRLLVGGAMTIFFSAIAMGFTLSIVGVNVSILKASIGTAQVGAAQGLQKNLFGELFDLVTGPSTPASAAALETMSVTMSSITNSGYWVMFLTGFISIMLHLAALRIASNISGSNDSATTAATVVGVGQMAAGKVLGVSRLGVGHAITASGQAAGGAAAGLANSAASLIGKFRGSGKP